MLNRESYFICIPVNLKSDITWITWKPYIEILAQSAPGRCHKGLKILNFGAVTNSKYNTCSGFFGFFLLYLAARQKINEEFRNNRDEKSEEKINEVFSCFLLFGIFFFHSTKGYLEIGFLLKGSLNQCKHIETSWKSGWFKKTSTWIFVYKGTDTSSGINTMLKNFVHTKTPK